MYCIGWEVINKKITNVKSKKPVFKLISPDNTEFIIYKGDVIRDKCIELKVSLILKILINLKGQ